MNDHTPAGPSQLSTYPMQPTASVTIEPEVPLRVRGKRSKNYWEPIFDPTKAPPVGIHDWDVSGKTSIEDLLCRSQELEARMRKRSQTRWPVASFTFRNCDFEGNFFNIIFKNCTFVGCDFGSCNWKNAKFSNCSFKKCSLSVCTFEQSQFIGCAWDCIGISGTETKFFDTTLSNPLDFIAAAWTNLEPGILAQNNKDAPYQSMRLEETKTKVARLILSNNERSSDDSTYYKSVEAYLRQIVGSKLSNCKYNIKNKTKLWSNIPALPIFYAESIFLRISGAVNNWGASVARPALVGFFIGVVFTAWYHFFGITPSFKIAAMKSFDVTLLFGYTKHATSSICFFEQISYAANAFLGLWWYAIFVPTIINRISRVR
ncbi:pentapeptide repeat-containing protein [Burkholderia sp. S171]|uniref:anti-phage Hailong system effector protein HalA n=1 Tax=Burkholderia sp. S171 TaxID=1641860 RepID=UPI00131D93CE|nr:pentapeptide repeat-containing protein [Burkholderia sp. S171]